MEINPKAAAAAGGSAWTSDAKPDPQEERTAKSGSRATSTGQGPGGLAPLPKRRRSPSVEADDGGNKRATRQRPPQGLAPQKSAPAAGAMHVVAWRRQLRDGQPPPFTQAAWDGHSDIGVGAVGAVGELRTDNPQIGSVAAKRYHDDGAEAEDEINGFRNLLTKAGPHKGILTVYGLADVPTPSGIRPALLMKNMHVNGAQLFGALRSMLQAGQINQSQFDGAVQLLTRRTVKAIRHINSAQMTHADIKPDSILAIGDEKARTVLSDLDAWSDDQNLNSGGDPAYQPPEIAGDPDREQIGFEAMYDIFSLGVTLREGTGGQMGPNTDYDDFLAGVMHSDPAQRLTPEAALAHPFLAKQTGELKAQSIAVLQRAIERAREAAEESDEASSQSSTS